MGTARANGERIYDPSTVTTIRGQVVRLQPALSRRGQSDGVHVTMHVEGSGEISVRLGPSWYLEDRGFTIRTGDTLQVTGSRVMLDGAPALVARTVTKGDEQVELRDEAGVPRWSAGRSRSGQGVGHLRSGDS
jgi:hypothetical protein